VQPLNKGLQKEKCRMPKSSNDRRTIRTKKMIRIALSELIEEKGFSNISITDITTKADINRGTFYLHYTDKYDLLEQIENELIQELQQHIKNTRLTDVVKIDLIDSMESVNKPIPYMKKVFEFVKENSVLMKAILGPNGDPKFQNKLKELIHTNIFEKNLIKAFNKENMLVPEEYFVSYLLSAHIGVVQKWLESGMEKTPEEVALILAKMSFLGPFKVTGLKSISDLFSF
jgi:AcrR family transcriptional regulator